MKAILFLLVAILCFPRMSTAQQSEPVPGDIIIRLNDPAVAPELVIRQVTGSSNRADSEVFVKKTLSQRAGIYLLQNNNADWSDKQLVKAFSKLPEINYAQLNYTATYRNDPNDPEIGQQWCLDIIKARQAWDITTGGVTANGDTIVIAVVDKGFEINHPDLASNIWVNKAEIPDDGVDNDNNGYIDDYYGWRFDINNDNHASEDHGTEVAGVIGAVGNNENGVTGINWHIKIMLLSKALHDAEIIAACYYAKDMREKYNTTNGAEGAFVVAANFSFGFDNAWPEDHPGWCNAFDDMGHVGIVSAGATNNEPINVDTDGDIPSTCTSEFLIVVTNTTQTDSKALSAAWGPLYVDLGAPGTDIYTTTIGNDYTVTNGTSFSTPMVAAAIGLLYSLPSGKLPEIALSDPASAAKLFRDFILDGVDRISGLEGITTTGGRLNLLKSMAQAKNFVTAATGDLDILKLYPNPTDDKLLLEYQTPGLYSYLVRIYDANGKLLIERPITPFDDFNQPLEFSVANFPAGVYALAIHNYKQVVSRKFVVFPKAD